MVLGFRPEENIGPGELTLSKVISVANPEFVRLIVGVTDNWQYVPLLHMGLIKGYEARFKSGKQKAFTDTGALFGDVIEEHVRLMGVMELGGEGPSWFPHKGRFIEFSYRGKKIRLRGNIHVYGMLLTENFQKESQGWLQPKGKVVFDVGAYYGDTAIYFALNGARHVYAFEPFPGACMLARENLRLNHLAGKVDVIQQAVGGKAGRISVPRGGGGIGAVLGNKTGKDGATVKGRVEARITTLDEIVHRYHPHDAVLKMDTEGGEYETILKASTEALRSFGRILIEYHYGYKNLEERLRRAGFKVWHTAPRFSRTGGEYKFSLVGTIYAERI